MTRTAEPPGPQARRATTTVRVGSEVGSYPVIVALGLLSELHHLVLEHAPAHRYAVITDDNVAPLHAEPLVDRMRSDGLDASLFVFPAGEASKTRAHWARLTDEMLDGGMGRDACVVAVGGGVTTDLAGFVAATFMRGIPLVQVPTSYLAMIDASVGGKTGVDTRHGKNLVGSFHPPRLVAVDPAAVTTLPEADRSEGLVEAFKHGAILDASYFERLSADVHRLLAGEPEAAQDAVLRSVEIKASVVTEDEREGGYRQVLNFGHTVGHAIEAAADFALGHGSAVALGMLVEAHLGERLGVTSPGTAERLGTGLARLRRPAAPIPEPTRIVGYLSADKKARGGRPRYVLLRELGDVDPGNGWTHEVSDDLVLDALRASVESLKYIS